MNKKDFLNSLKGALKGLPEDEITKTIDYYSELIDDAVEDGADEQSFIAELGNINTIAEKIADETPIHKLVVQEVRSKKLNAGAIILIILGSPIWLSLLAAVFAAVVSVYLAAWSVVVSLFAADIGLAATALLSIAASPFVLFENSAKALFLFGSALFCAGLAVIGFFGCVWCAKKLIQFTVFAAKKTKHKFIRKEADRI